LYPDFPETLSANSTSTGHDGLFTIRKTQLEEYADRFNPKFLRFSKSTPCNRAASYFGQTMGLTFDRIVILPTNKIEKFLAGKSNELKDSSLAKFYVAITRARHSVAFLYEGSIGVDGVYPYRIEA
jgi:DNA helicase-2/ATP-dependent DNA helicase PcrA